MLGHSETRKRGINCLRVKGILSGVRSVRVPERLPVTLIPSCSARDYIQMPSTCQKGKQVFSLDIQDYLLLDIL